MTFQNGTVSVKVSSADAGYEGKLSADGTAMTGTWIQGVRTPLELLRATPETEWKDPYRP